MGRWRPKPGRRRSIARRNCSSASSSRTRPLGVGELSESAGLPKSTTSRLVGALERRGLVQRAGDRRVSPGPVLLRFAHRDPGESLVELATPALQRARPALRRDDQPRRADAARRRASRAGGHAATSSAARTGSAAASPTSRPRTARCCSAFASRAAATASEIRTRGYAIAVDELEHGLSALAAPDLRARRRRRRGPLDLRADHPAHPRPHRRARAGPARAGAASSRCDSATTTSEVPHDPRRDSQGPVRRDAHRQRARGEGPRRTRASQTASAASRCSTTR